MEEETKPLKQKQIKEPTDEEQYKALMIIGAVYNEIALGTKHYSKSTGTRLLTPVQIITAMKENDLVFEPRADRKALFIQLTGG